MVTRVMAVRLFARKAVTFLVLCREPKEGYRAIAEEMNCCCLRCCQSARVVPAPVIEPARRRPVNVLAGTSMSRSRTPSPRPQRQSMD
jgi:hypothetical protein